MSTITKSLKTLNPRHPDTKYMGDEQVWATQPAADSRASKIGWAYNWYNYFYGKKEAKEMIAVYLERAGRNKDAKKIRATPDSKINLTVGWTCRMVTMGLELTEQESATLNKLLAEILLFKEQPKETVDEEPQVPRVTIQDRLREKVSECAGELEGMFDEFVASGAKMNADWKPIATIRGMNVAPQMIGIISDIWKRKLAEYEEAVEGKDPQLVEAYSHLGKVQLRNIVKFCETVINDCAAYVQIKKVERKPRKAKVVSPEKRAAKFKVLAEFAELKLKGLPAASLVDKTEAWLYDTKKRKLIHIVADEHTKAFTIKSNSIIGFSAAETMQKTLRKPADTLKALGTAGKPAARKIFKDLTTTETAWTGRGNENLIVLKSW